MKYTLGIVKLDPYLINREFSDPKDIYEADERYERIPHKFLVTEDSDFLWFYADKCISHEILKERLGLERVLGGGCLSIDPKLKALVLDNYSGDFGAVPKPVLEKFGKL